MQEKYLEVSEMGVDVGAPTKRLKVTEVEIPKDPAEVERDKRQRLINENLTRLMTRTSSFAISDALVNVMSLSKGNSMLDDYDSWKLLAMYMAGKLSILEEMKN